MVKKVATLEQVSKTYGKDDLIVKALDNIDLEIYKGDYLAVMGASGSGKSTAMNIIGCLDRPSQGVYKLNGTPVENLSDDELAELRNQKLGFVFQQFHLLSDATALENVLLPMIYFAMKNGLWILREYSIIFFLVCFQGFICLLYTSPSPRDS